MSKLKDFLKKKGYTPVKLYPLHQMDDEPVHYLISAKINGKKGLFLLDTGATHTMLNISKAKKFGIKTEDLANDMVFVGASEDAIDVQMSSRPIKVRIKKWKQKNLPLFLMDMSHVNELLPFEIDGIIGTDILLAGKAVLDYDKGVMYLKKQ